MVMLHAHFDDHISLVQHSLRSRTSNAPKIQKKNRYCDIFLGVSLANWMRAHVTDLFMYHLRFLLDSEKQKALIVVRVSEFYCFKAPHGRLTGFELDISRRTIDNSAMESPSIATPGNVEKKEKFVPPVDVIDFSSGFGLKVIDLTGEVVKNATPTPLEKKGQKFVPPVNVTADLTGEDSRDSGTLVRLRLDRESPEKAGQEQSVGNKAADVNVEDSEETSGSSRRPDQEPPEEAGQLLQSPVIVSVAAESQGDSQAAENWPQAITILSDGDGNDKDENKSERGNSVSDKAADVNAENNEDVSGTSRRQDRGQDEEPPEQNEQLFQSPVAKSVATDHIPPRRFTEDLRGADLELHPSFEKTLHLHQKKGFQFLTRTLFGGQQGGYESKGCALAHAPGTGKTCLVISFIQSFLTRFPEGKPLILAPAIMLQSWKDQFDRWMVSEVPIYTLGGSACDQDEEDVTVAPHVKTPLKEVRALELREWQKGRSILLLSYNLFLRLVSNGLKDNVLPNSLDDQITKALKESADLVILDEGHIARNKRSLITQAVLALKTKRRVLLSGTLFHNNFEELFTLLKICRYDFLRSDPEFATKISSLKRKRKGLMHTEKEIFMEEIGNRLENWEKSGVASTDGIESVVEKFQSLTSLFVDRYPGEILKTLPGLIEHSIHLNLTAFQSEEIVNGLVNSEQVKNHLIKHHKITAACIHPSLALVGEKASLPFSTRNSSPLQDEAWKGVKISFILQLMKSSNIAKEKLLIFCSTLRPLKYIEDLCCEIWGWRKGQQILRLDGGMLDVDRQKAIQQFNDSGSQSQVLLASTFACKEGISLVGASRVVILDCLYNPSVVRQAVSRAFRMGQKKKVYVYRLVTMHSYEVQVFRRSVSKEKLSLVLLDPVSTISNLSKFLQEQRASDVEDELLRDIMLYDIVNGSHINSVQRYNAICDF